MTITAIKQHTFKNGSVKAITQDNYDGYFDTVYRVTLTDKNTMTSYTQTFYYLKNAIELYESIAI